MKTKIIPFDSEKAKAGAKVVTRGGCSVRIADYAIKDKEHPILGLVDSGRYETPETFTDKGRAISNNVEPDYDLFIEEEKEKPRREYSGTDSIYVPKDDEGIREELIDAINGLWDNDALPMPLTLKRQTAWITWLQKQGREKSADNNPKFQEGDWVVFNPECNAHQIIRVVENASSHTYGYVTVDDYCFNDTVEGMRLWNINDAKDGDVLCYETKDEFRIFIYKNGHVHFHCHYYNGHLITVDSYFVIPKHLLCYIHPATKEQRDLLFQKIKEAGYKWDSDKKELHKIEKVKTRRMTNQELSWWLRDCPEEHREYSHEDGRYVQSGYYDYFSDDANVKVNEYIRIRKNGGEWQEPIIKI